MNNEERMELCLRLLKADTENEVIDILVKAGYWNDISLWRDFGDNENNFSIIGAQQKSPDTAFVEKIVNSVDAVLMRECLRRKIDPEGNEAPQSIEEALEMFFNIRFGKLSSLTAKQRRELAENIQIVATGEKTNPSYTIIDKGEGQTPAKMPLTILSLSRSNKLRIPFVQGRFNMGGTGALRFCGKENLQLIISRRDPKIVKIEGDDGTSNLWGFTIVRRVYQIENMKNSVYKYLAPDKNNLLTFSAEYLPVIPDRHPIAYMKPFHFGTIIKLYEYQFPGTLRSMMNFALYNRLSLLLSSLALPIRLVERRDYKSYSPEVTLSGLSVRLEEDKRNNLENGFPASNTLVIDGQELKVTIYAFKKVDGQSKKDNYAKNEGIIFTVNGQYHGHFDKKFFLRKAVSLGYLKDYILVVVDCSGLTRRIREDLFMNSRDRLSECEFKRKIEKALEDLLKNHEGLKELKEKRKREAFLEGGNIDNNFKNILSNLIRNSPTLSQLLIFGEDIKNPFDFRDAETDNSVFTGERFPTFFKLIKEFPQDRPKDYYKNSKARVKFETDVENDYFSREDYAGTFDILVNGEKGLIKEAKINLWNGIATLNFLLPPYYEIDEIIKITTIVTDPSQINPFENTFYVRVRPEQNFGTGQRGNREQPVNNIGSEDRKIPSKLKEPKIIEVTKDSWTSHNFNEESAIKVLYDESEYIFYVNMHNKYLLNELKRKEAKNELIIRQQFKYSLVLMALSLLNIANKQDNNNEKNNIFSEDNIYDVIYEFGKAMAPFLIPMISGLSEIERLAED